MVSGDCGLTGLSVPRAVVEEVRPGRDSVTVQPQPTVVQNVRGITLRGDSAILAIVTKVNNLHAYLKVCTLIYFLKQNCLMQDHFAAPSRLAPTALA